MSEFNGNTDNLILRDIRELLFIIADAQVGGRPEHVVAKYKRFTEANLNKRSEEMSEDTSVLEADFDLLGDLLKRDHKEWVPELRACGLVALEHIRAYIEHGDEDV